MFDQAKRKNWTLVQKYLVDRKEIDNLDDRSIRNEETWLEFVLDWAGAKHFYDAPKIRPTFPVYMLTARRDGGEEPLSPEYVKKVIRATKRFFKWLWMGPKGYKTLDANYCETLQVPRMETEPKERRYVSFEEIKAIAQAETTTMLEERLQASLVLMWLTGVRPGAFVTLPISAVDLNNLEIKVYPSLGVRVKNKTGRNVHILNIPDLLAVVRNWDNKVREALPKDGLWFASLLPSTGDFDLTANIYNVGKNRYRILQRNTEKWLNKLGLEYYSPHLFRHGNAVYKLKHAKTMDDLKAISQNLGHASLVTTDSIYSKFDNKDVKERIARISLRSGNGGLEGISNEELLLKIQELLAELTQKNRE